MLNYVVLVNGKEVSLEEYLQMKERETTEAIWNNDKNLSKSA